jgi:hypothetical protein
MKRTASAGSRWEMAQTLVFAAGTATDVCMVASGELPDFITRLPKRSVDLVS